MKRLFQITLLALFTLLPASAFSQELLSVKHGGLSISLSEKANGSFRVAIKTTQKSISTEILALENPSRLVIDVLDVKSNSSLSQSISHPLFTSLRIGVHPSKTRLVFDINHPRKPFFSESKNGNELTVDLSIPGISKPAVETAEPEVPVAATKEIAIPKESDAVKQTPDPTVEAVDVKEEPKAEIITPEVKEAKTEITPTPDAEELKFEAQPVIEENAPEKNVEESAQIPATQETAVIPVTQEATKTEAAVESNELNTAVEPNIVPTPEVTPGIEEQDTALESNDGGFFPESQERALIKDILFKRTQDQENAIAIQVENLGRYSFIKSAEQSYSLVVENAKADDEEKIILTQFPPEGYQGIEAVTAYRKGKNIIVKVYVEKNITLLPYRQGAELWIKASK